MPLSHIVKKQTIAMRIEKEEHRQGLKIQLLALWMHAEALLTEEDKTKNAALISTINHLLNNTAEDWTWLECNEAELLLLPLLPDAALEAQFRTQLRKALKVRILTADEYKETIARFFGTDAIRPRAVMQEAYRTLLSELHQNYISLRFRREQRLETALRLLKLSALILLFATLPVLIFSLAPLGDVKSPLGTLAKTALVRDPLFGLYAAGSFGIVGAFFSRLVPFQGRIQQYNYEQLLHTFSPRFIALRCTIGMLGAIAFFLLMRGGLLGGSLFPAPDRLADLGGGSASIPEFAKLLVWSFIAGWSERLVPEALERTENTSKVDAEKKPGASSA